MILPDTSTNIFGGCLNRAGYSPQTDYLSRILNPTPSLDARSILLSQVLQRESSSGNPLVQSSGVIPTFSDLLASRCTNRVAGPSVSPLQIQYLRQLQVDHCKSHAHCVSKELKDTPAVPSDFFQKARVGAASALASMSVLRNKDSEILDGNHFDQRVPHSFSVPIVDEIEPLALQNNFQPRFNLGNGVMNLNEGHAVENSTVDNSWDDNNHSKGKICESLPRKRSKPDSQPDGLDLTLTLGRNPK